MADQSKLPCGAEKGRRLDGLSQARPCAPVGRGQLVILIYYPLENNANACNGNVSVDALLKFLKAVGAHHSDICSSNHIASCASCRHDQAEAGLEQFGSSSNTKIPTVNVAFNAACQFQNHVASTASETLLPTMFNTTNCPQHLLPGDNTLGHNTLGDNILFEDFINDAEMNSMFDEVELGNQSGMAGNMGDTFSSTNAITSMSSSTSSNPITIETAANDITSTASITSSVPAATQPTVALPISNVNNRFVCTYLNCGTDFTRIGDLRRHHLTHGPPAHPCTANGCARRGRNGFHRRDKLLNHMRKKHGMAV